MTLLEENNRLAKEELSKQPKMSVEEFIAQTERVMAASGRTPQGEPLNEFSDIAKVRSLMRLLRLRITMSHEYLNTPLADLPPKWQEAMLAEGKGLPKEYLDIPGVELVKILRAHGII